MSTSAESSSLHPRRRNFKTMRDFSSSRRSEHSCIPRGHAVRCSTPAPAALPPVDGLASTGSCRFLNGLPLVARPLHYSLFSLEQTSLMSRPSLDAKQGAVRDTRTPYAPAFDSGDTASNEETFLVRMSPLMRGPWTLDLHHYRTPLVYGMMLSAHMLGSG